MKALLRSFFLTVLSLVVLAAGLPAQTQSDLERYFEGKMVVVKIDMPATSQGVDIFPGREQKIDYSTYAQRLKDHGTALFPGDRIMVTKVKCKARHIEFQLGGGGYGTFLDDNGYTSVPYVEKSKREKNLKEEIKKEKDPARKKALQEEYDDLKKERELEERKLQMEAQQQNRESEAQIRAKAGQSGSRFNIRYDSNLDAEHMTPAAVIAALDEFLEFRRSLSDNSPVRQMTTRHPASRICPQFAKAFSGKKLLPCLARHRLFLNGWRAA